jgi:hypothetical protein
MTIGNRGLGGQPNLPYTDFESYAGQDVFGNLSFLDHTDTPVVPTTLFYRIDDLTNAKNMIPLTAIPITGAVMVIQIPGAQLPMTYPYQGSQICQISFNWTALDTITGASFQGNSVSVIELVAIQVPN